MADILDELKDDIKQERYEKLITVHGPKLIVVAVFLVLITAVYKFYNSNKYEDSVESGKVFYDAFESNRSELYDDIISSDHEGFSILASFAKAGVSNSKGEVDVAISALEEVKGVSSEHKALEDYANLTKLYIISADKEKWQGKEADINAELERIYTSGSPFSISAKHVHAMFLYNTGEKERALTLFTDLATQREVPASVNERAKKFISIIKNET